MLIHLLHRKVVVRALPVCELFCMATGTYLDTNEGGRLHAGAWRCCCLLCGSFASAQDHANRYGNDDIKKMVWGPVNDMNGRERYRKNPGAANRMRNSYTNIASYSDSDRAGFFPGLGRCSAAAVSRLTSMRRNS
jgi:hypothetical protein